ncbi:class I SAM-dependent methyltransferase [Humibacter ginsenosidimutans]|uniref:Class I SAM-dependent methyltransferase n=1 Tax=Humibacter ginsenosidimutans TaxID=2599293 RepID=A0A5B8M5Y3_9MICO|nr:methyltransferase domain-containing protein [Humibacter ginsenosidimutans]QDZ15215.1 class I SAM-dependent methyltransferase [Humibacter ginsenosidimutans]
MPDFDSLIAEGEAVPTEGWDFSWFLGRATEERPSWGYARLAARRASGAVGVLDVQTGGGEVFAEVLRGADPRPAAVAATEGWHPNVALAREALAPFGGIVVESLEDAPLPFADASFALVLSRHPVVTDFAEIGRVLAPGGTYLSQQIGERSNAELYEFLLGPQPVDDVRTIDRMRERAQSAGLEIVDLREERTRIEFFDIAAVVHFLRKVIWTVPGFTVDAYRDRLREIHEIIRRDGAFVSYSSRILLEARRPTS